MKDHNLQLQLVEGLIDEHSIVGLLDMAEEVCHLKAQHLRENWQDETSAKHWERRGRSVAKAKTLKGLD